jgi:hypothetical protein
VPDLALAQNHEFQFNPLLVYPKAFLSLRNPQTKDQGFKHSRELEPSIVCESNSVIKMRMAQKDRWKGEQALVVLQLRLKQFHLWPSVIKIKPLRRAPKAQPHVKGKSQPSKPAVVQGIAFFYCSLHFSCQQSNRVLDLLDARAS